MAINVYYTKTVQGKRLVPAMVAVDTKCNKGIKWYLDIPDVCSYQNWDAANSSLAYFVWRASIQDLCTGAGQSSVVAQMSDIKADHSVQMAAMVPPYPSPGIHLFTDVTTDTSGLVADEIANEILTHDYNCPTGGSGVAPDTTGDKPITGEPDSTDSPPDDDEGEGEGEGDSDPLEGVRDAARKEGMSGEDIAELPGALSYAAGLIKEDVKSGLAALATRIASALDKDIGPENAAEMSKCMNTPIGFTTQGQPIFNTEEICNCLVLGDCPMSEASILQAIQTSQGEILTTVGVQLAEFAREIGSMNATIRADIQASRSDTSRQIDNAMADVKATLSTRLGQVTNLLGDAYDTIAGRLKGVALNVHNLVKDAGEGVSDGIQEGLDKVETTVAKVQQTIYRLLSMLIMAVAGDAVGLWLDAMGVPKTGEGPDA